jgi:molybdopterin synthase sulfur carrier subunit
MIISVKFFSIFREKMRRRKVDVEVPENITIEELLDLLSKKFGRRFSDLIYGSQIQSLSNIKFTLNGISTSHLQGLQTRLKNCDEIAIIPPVGGG